MPDSHGGAPNEVDRRMALAREWDTLVAQVRELPGFEDFLQPPSLEKLLPAAEAGPVVIVNVSRWRCDALIVTSAGVHNCELRTLVLQDCVDRANGYLNVLRAAEQANEHHASAVIAADQTPGRAAFRVLHEAAAAVQRSDQAADDMLTATLEWMWDTIAEPVLDELDKLGFTTGPDKEAWPRVWWCPTGPLTLLPLHAAGYHRETSATTPRTVLDRVISSYTPTVRALAEARRPPGAEDEEQAQERMLVIGVPNAPDQIPLDAIDDERAAIEQALPDRHTILWDDNATVDAVLQDLPRHRWAHFSCHGHQNLTDPSEGGLLLHDGMLTITDVARRRFHGDFVGLSACKTAVGGVELLDEAITLAAALPSLPTWFEAPAP